MKIINYAPQYKISILATLVGLLTGVVSIAFNKVLSFSFDHISVLYNDTSTKWFLPFIVAIIIGLIRHNLLQDKNQGFGVAQVMFEIENIKTLMMKPFDVLVKMIGTFLTLIAGFSAGRQGPIVHLGGAIGSNIAYSAKLSDDETRVLIGCGVAGCLAGVFNSPIFATLFVVEILFKKRYFDMIATILLSAVASTVIVRFFDNEHFLGNFVVNYEFNFSELFYFIILGFVLGLIAIVYIIALRRTKYFFDHLNCMQILKNIIGAVAITIALNLLSNYYVYNFNVSEFFNHHFSSIELVLIVFLYIFLTAVTIGSGGIGGIFAPGLFIGMTAGLAFSSILIGLGIPLVDIKIYAIAGMAAMYAGFAIAPLSGALMIVELTGQYNLIFPLLITTLIASKVSETFIHESIYHQNLKDLLKD